MSFLSEKNDRKQAKSVPARKRGRGLPAHWQALRRRVADSGHALTSTVFEQVSGIFHRYYASDDGSRLAALTREYLHEEFLLVVDGAGQPVLPGVEVLNSFQETACAYPSFANWFRVSEINEGPYRGQPVLLTARWLCHLSGLRHFAIELFLDPPGWPGTTLLQIRGVNKVESPANFDMPCAGHISGVDGVEWSLWKELEEELGLGPDDLEEMREVLRFDSPSDSGPEPRNREFRVLYQARLKAGRAGSIHLREEEVAGLAVISLSELYLLVERFPERIASGLKEALPYYQK